MQIYMIKLETKANVFIITNTDTLETSRYPTDKIRAEDFGTLIRFYYTEYASPVHDVNFSDIVDVDSNPFASVDSLMDWLDRSIGNLSSLNTTTDTNEILINIDNTGGLLKLANPKAKSYIINNVGRKGLFVRYKSLPTNDIFSFEVEKGTSREVFEVNIDLYAKSDGGNTDVVITEKI